MFLQLLRVSVCGLTAAILMAGCDSGLIRSDNPSDSVSDVLHGDRAADQDFGDALVRARIRNESSLAAEVNLRFVRGNQPVHAAFVRVLPDTITTVATPRTPETLELSGEDEMGEPLATELFRFGVDFDELRPAEYWIRDPDAEPPPVRPTPGTPITQLTLLEPATDVVLTIGELLTIAWNDDSIDPQARVALFIMPIGSRPGDAVELRRDLPAAGDGLADQIDVVLQGLRPGQYIISGRIEDGPITQWAAAPGTVTLQRSLDNVVPTISLLSPDGPVALRTGEFLEVKWTDADPDDNATVTFGLESITAAGSAVTFPITSSLPENPDGSSDTVRARIDVVPGTYDLIGLITDGRLSASIRLRDWVTVLPPAQNDPPHLLMLEPAQDQMLEIGSVLRARWTDSDADHDAVITLLLDPDLMNVPLNGNEIILAAGLSEDADGPGDIRDLAISAATPSGVFRLVGVIRDGLTEVLAAAPGMVYVNRDPQTPGGGGGGPGGGGGGPGGGDPGGGDNPGENPTDLPTDGPDPIGGSGGGSGSNDGLGGDPPHDELPAPTPSTPR